MTPNELYAREPEKIDKDLNHIKTFYTCHIPELQGSIDWFPDDCNEKVEFKIYKDFDFDGRRGWFLASMWFEGKPVMIIQNAGRELDDHSNSFISDESAYREMVKYIQTLIPIDVDEVITVEGDTDYPQLTEFYGNSLDGQFTRY